MTIPTPVPSLPLAVPSTMTHRDYLLEASREMGFESRDENGYETLPTDVQELADIKTAVDRAMKVWSNANPSGWIVMRTVYSMIFSPDGTGPLCIDLDAGRYAMPWWFNGQFVDGFKSGTPTINMIRAVSEDEFNRRVYSYGFVASGRPEVACFRKLTQDQYPHFGVRRWEVAFWPKPSTADTIYATMEMQVSAFSDLADPFPAGEPYDRSLRDCVRWASADVMRATQDIMGERKAAMQESLAEAIAYDNRLRPVDCGTLRVTPISGDWMNTTAPDGIVRYVSLS